MAHLKYRVVPLHSVSFETRKATMFLKAVRRYRYQMRRLPRETRARQEQEEGGSTDSDNAERKRKADSLRQ